MFFMLGVIISYMAALSGSSRDRIDQSSAEMTARAGQQAFLKCLDRDPTLDPANNPINNSSDCIAQPHSDHAIQTATQRNFGVNSQLAGSGPTGLLTASITGNVQRGSFTNSHIKKVEVPKEPFRVKLKADTLSAGLYHSCALDYGGQAYCWGSNGRGELGDGSRYYHSYNLVPVDVSGALAGKRLVQVSAGYFFTCALDSQGRAYCWGEYGYGQLGDGTRTERRSPVAVNASGALAKKHLVRISAGDKYACALDSEGRAYCWGRNDFGQLGSGTTASSLTPVAVDTSVLSARSW